MKLSPCLEWMYSDDHAEMGDRIRAAANDGYPQGEFHLWRDKDLDSIAKALIETGAVLTGICSDPRCKLTDPSQHDKARTAFEESAQAATKIGKPPIIVSCGPAHDDATLEEQFEACVAVLRDCARIGEQYGVTFVLEPVNNQDLPGVYLTSTKLGLDMVEAVGRPNLRLLYDLYHSTTMGEDYRDVLDGRMDLVRHIQVADCPGRHEPGTGSIDWPDFMQFLQDNCYAGDIGLEYVASMSPPESLALARKTLLPTE